MFFFRNLYISLNFDYLNVMLGYKNCIRWYMEIKYSFLYRKIFNRSHRNFILRWKFLLRGNPDSFLPISFVRITPTPLYGKFLVKIATIKIGILISENPFMRRVLPITYNWSIWTLSATLRPVSTLNLNQWARRDGRWWDYVQSEHSVFVRRWQVSLEAIFSKFFKFIDFFR